MALNISISLFRLLKGLTIGSLITSCFVFLVLGSKFVKFLHKRCSKTEVIDLSIEQNNAIFIKPMPQEESPGDSVKVINHKQDVSRIDEDMTTDNDKKDLATDGDYTVGSPESHNKKYKSANPMQKTNEINLQKNHTVDVPTHVYNTSDRNRLITRNDSSQFTSTSSSINNLDDKTSSSSSLNDSTSNTLTSATAQISIKTDNFNSVTPQTFPKKSDVTIEKKGTKDILDANDVDVNKDEDVTLSLNSAKKENKNTTEDKTSDNQTDLNLSSNSNKYTYDCENLYKHMDDLENPGGSVTTIKSNDSTMSSSSHNGPDVWTMNAAIGIIILYKNQ